MILAAVWYHMILATLFASIAILLMLVILLQRGRGVGLSGAFGGVGGSSALGAKTGDILTWITMVGAGVFIALAITLNFFFRPSTPTDPNATPAGGAPTNTTDAPGGDDGAWHVVDPSQLPKYAHLLIFDEHWDRS